MVKAEVVLPDRKHAKLWSGMRHEEYADEAPLYKILKDAASDFHDLDNLGDPGKDVAISCSSRFVARLYDQKSFASSHHNINKLRVKLATKCLNRI
jgi:hypothetical protein